MHERNSGTERPDTVLLVFANDGESTTSDVLAANSILERMYESTSGIEHHPNTVLLTFACDSEGTTSDVVEEGPPRRSVRHIRVDLFKALLADTLATLSGKNISVLLLRGVSPSLTTIIGILHAVQGSQTSLDVALLTPPQVGSPVDVDGSREDKSSVSSLLPSVSLGLQKLSCKLAYSTAQESPTTALVDWLITTGSFAHLQELVVDVGPQPGGASQEDLLLKF